MDAKVVSKYAKKSPAELKKLAQKYFNGYIRARDSGQPCISCGTGKPEHAGHFYSAGHYTSLRFNEDNCHGQCIRCNYFLSGNTGMYRVNLEKKIGKERLLKLDELAAIGKRSLKKWDRFELIDIIETYKAKTV